jgi:alkanesulfonate monooxygenase SsuD/methylene tetrahydromethanopterin reductase-like flavin-dependent oxidoreductase (luciferase family)
MKFGLFFLMQVPRPWDDEAEHRKYKEALEQIELADRLGFHSVFSAEHHSLEEYAHASAPEMLLAAASQRTRNIRLGQGIATLPDKVNHPFRVAERIAWLDLLSDGRAEFGTGESTGTRELGGFGVDIETKEQQWHEGLHAIVKLWTDTAEYGRFQGFEGSQLSLPPRGIRPMPYQKPHPPLWVACPRPETLWKATTHGAGSLCFTLSLEPERAREKWVELYYEGLESDDWVPLSDTVNPNIVAVSAAMLHHDEQTALERGIDGAHFMGWAISHYYFEQGYDPDYASDVYEQFLKERSAGGFDRDLAMTHVDKLSTRIQHGDQKSLRAAIGTPDQVREFMRRYEDAGMDQMLLQFQLGKNEHEHICEAMELFAKEVMPEFLERDAELQAKKMERLQPAIDRALERRRRGERPADPVTAGATTV